MIHGTLGGATLKRPYVCAAVTCLCGACRKKFRRTKQGLSILLTALCLLLTVVVRPLRFIGLLKNPLTIVSNNPWLTQLKFLVLIPNTLNVRVVTLVETALLRPILVKLCI